MRILPKPTAVPADVFTTCISKVADARLKARLTAVTPLVAAAAVAFDTAAQNSRMHSLQRQEIVGASVTAAQMSAVYTGRMAKKGSPGRAVYDQLIAVPSHGRCPLCGQRVAATLDHYLPHTQFPALAVTPINLVPSCFDCNKSKRDVAPNTAEEQTLHPYFDDVEGARWLVADVVEQNPAALKFYVDPPVSWIALTAARVQRHFEVFKLAQLFASHSAEELLNIRQQIASLHAAAGPDEVRSHLLERRDSCEANHLNSWQSATYRALAGSDWYVEGGFA
jgi:hypothetical protein